MMRGSRGKIRGKIKSRKNGGSEYVGDNDSGGGYDGFNENGGGIYVGMTETTLALICNQFSKTAYTQKKWFWKVE